MKLREIVAAIREYPGIRAELELAQSQLSDTRRTLEKSEQKCNLLSATGNTRQSKLDHTERRLLALSTALSSFCPKLSTAEEMQRLYECIHRDFIYAKAIPALERMGVKVIVLRSEKTYVDLFTGRITRGPRKGMVRSFPICGRCAVQRDCKLHPIRAYQKTLPPDTVQYIGIARDEQERLLRLDGNKISLLDKYGCTEQDAKQLCQQAGLLSPVYAFTGRGGCWFCPNAKRKELRHLYDHHPDLWARMVELQAVPGKVSEKFNRTERFSDIDAEFRLQDAQESLFPDAA